MKLRCLVALAVAALIAAPTQADDSLKQTLLDLETKVLEAIKRQDKAKLQSILSEQEIAVTADGGRQTLAELLRSLDEVTLSSYRVEDVQCVRISPDVGILTYRFTWSGTCDGRPVATTVLATSTWANRDGEWKSVFYQETPLPKLLAVSSD